MLSRHDQSFFEPIVYFFIYFTISYDISHSELESAEFSVIIWHSDEIL